MATAPLFLETNQSNQDKKRARRKKKSPENPPWWRFTRLRCAAEFHRSFGMISSLLKYSWWPIRCLWPPFIIRDLQTFELEPGQ